MPLLMKQAVAVIDKRTTMVCLRVAGQVRPVDEPFDTLMGDIMEPPFHVHCRTLVAPWMPGMTSDIRKDANAEIALRPPKEKRFGPGGYGGSLPPRGPSQGPITPTPPPPGPGSLGQQMSVDDLKVLADTPADSIDERVRNIFHAQNYDALPSYGDSPGQPIYRGVGKDEWATDLKYGEKPFIGRGINGQGWYFTTDEQNARDYGASVVSATLRSDASTIDAREALEEMMGEWAWESEEGQLMRRISGGDPGLWATLRGFDALTTNAGGKTHYIVLNRAALVVKE